LTGRPGPEFYLDIKIKQSCNCSRILSPIGGSDAMPFKRRIATPQPPKRSSRKVSNVKHRVSRDKNAKKEHYAKAARLQSRQ